MDRGSSYGLWPLDFADVRPVILESASISMLEAVGPVWLKTGWQAKAGRGYDILAFGIGWNCRT